MFAMAVQEEDITIYNNYIFICTIALAFIASMVTSYNNIQKIKSKLPKLEADIKSVKKMRNSLLEKANKVEDKYLSHESSIMVQVANSRTNIKRVKNFMDFKTIVEAYPDLKSNTGIIKLLEQLENIEERLLKIRLEYTEKTAKYNEIIHTFPIVIFRKLLKLEEYEIKDDDYEEELVTDEELGIKKEKT